jgi:hypothetical protein
MVWFSRICYKNKKEYGISKFQLINTTHGAHGASDEFASPEILMEEGFGSDPVDGSVLGLPEFESEMFSKDHRLGNVVLVSTARDGLVPVSSGPSPSTSLLEQESATMSTLVHLFPSGSSSGAVELGERLLLSRPMASTSKPFLKYYRKAREGRVVKMDERLFSNSVAAMISDFADGFPFPLSSATPASELPLESKLVQSSRVPPLVDVAAFVKDVIKRTPPARGFLQRGFLNLRPARQVSSKVLVVSPLTLVVKEDVVVGTPSHLCRCVSPSIDKGEDLRVSCLVESQRWLVGFSPFGEVVMWDQGDEVWDGEDGVSPFPLGVYPPDEEDEAPLLAILDARVSEEEFHRESMVVRQKTKGKKEMLNLKSSINYGDDYATSRRRKGKAHMM